MSISIPIPHELLKHERALSQLLSEICRRALDGTTTITYSGGDIKITNVGSGLVLPIGNTGNFGRLTLDNNLVLTVNQI